jgi:hypothetical protein
MLKIISVKSYWNFLNEKVGMDILLSGKYSDIIFIVDIKFIFWVLYEKSFMDLNNIYYWKENE